MGRYKLGMQEYGGGIIVKGKKKNSWLIFNHLVANIYDMYQRNITNSILDALNNTPVVLVNGARQIGQSALSYV